MQAKKERIAKGIFARVLKGIKPSKEELEKSVYHINMLTSRLREVMPKDVEARVVGSVVRGTQLRGDSDIDIFLLFNRNQQRERITKKGLEYAKKIVGKGERYEIKYAEHPYVRLYLDKLGLRADIVPAFRIDDIKEMGTAVDRSPMHAEFINASLSDGQRDDVRLMKYLLARHGIYGADIATSGFSGYLCELLIYQYGSLLSLMEAASGCSLPLMIDPRNRAELKDRKLIAKFNSKLIVIDPVDPDRNVAAGCSIESFAKFIIVARRFIENPDIKLFYDHRFATRDAGRLTDDFLKESGLGMFTLELKVPDKSKDIVWPQLRKVADFIKERAEKLGFKVYFTIPVVKARKGLIAFIAPKEQIGSRLLKGPSALMCKAQTDFSKKHGKALGLTMIGENIYALERNEFGNLGDFLRAVALGRMMKRHKDITVSGGRLHSGRVPKEYAGEVYSELMKKIRI